MDLQHDRFTGPGLRHNKGALSLTDGRYKINHPRRQVLEVGIIDLEASAVLPDKAASDCRN